MNRILNQRADSTVAAPGPDSRFVLLAMADMHGALRGKAFTKRAFDALMEVGETAVTDLLLTLDPVDEPITDYEQLGIRAGAGDLRATPEPGTLRALPWRPGWSICLMTPSWPDGRACELAPRTVLERAIEGLARQGHEAVAAFEYEVLLRDRSSGDPISRGISYDLLALTRIDGLVEALDAALRGLGIEPTAFHTEPAPGMLEINLAARPALQAADEACLLKLAVKDVAEAHGLEASFLAKAHPSQEGCGGHLHVSLWDGDGPTFAGVGDDPDAVSPVFGHAIGGVLRHLPAASLLYNPTINSYKRLVPGWFAPVNVSWGIENRSASVRAIAAARDSARRLECRRPGADANPYLALAALLASIAIGIEEGIDPPPPVSGDVSVRDDLPALPGSLEASLHSFGGDSVLRDALGKEFSAYYEVSRRWELAQWQASVTDWERERYGAVA